MPLHENLSHSFLFHTKQLDQFIVDNTIMNDRYVDLSHVPHSDEHLFIVYNGSLLNEGSSNDFTLTGQRIDFTAGFILNMNDLILAIYRY